MSAIAQLKVLTKLEKTALKTEDTILPTSTKDDKFKQLEAVEKALNKQFSTTASLTRMGKQSKINVPCTPTGIYTLDFGVLGIGGVPDGRIIEVFGPESSGKTTITLEMIAEEQRRGNLAAFVDAEHALDPQYASKLGVDMDELIISQPDSGEQALETVEALVDSKAISIIVIDSVAALVPQAELNGEMGDSNMGLHARLMSQACRKLAGKAHVNGVKLVFINQIRDKIGVMFGNPETTTGGKALKFWSSVRLEVKRKSDGAEGANIKQGNEIIGHHMSIKAVKNKVASPYGSTVVDLIYGKGVDRERDFIQYATDIGALTKAAAWYKFEGENIGNGFDATVLAIKSDQLLFDRIKKEVAKKQKEKVDV